jgi:hypothetical protein
MPKQPPKPDSNNPEKLPDNLNDCHSLIKELFSRIAELEKQLSRRNRAAFGRKSAKVDATLLTGTGKAIHAQTTAELEAENNRLSIVEDKNRGGGRSAPPPTLDTRREEHCLEAIQINCPCCGEPRQIIGFEVSHQIEC